MYLEVYVLCAIYVRYIIYNMMSANKIKGTQFYGRKIGLWQIVQSDLKFSARIKSINFILILYVVCIRMNLYKKKSYIHIYFVV